MNIALADWKRACLATTVLLALAAFIAVGIKPGGFERQGAWLLLLLPGSLPAFYLADTVYKIAPAVERLFYRGFSMRMNFAWYWFLSFISIKIYRAV